MKTGGNIDATGNPIEEGSSLLWGMGSIFWLLW